MANSIVGNISISANCLSTAGSSLDNHLFKLFSPNFPGERGKFDQLERKPITSHALQKLAVMFWLCSPSNICLFVYDEHDGFHYHVELFVAQLHLSSPRPILQFGK